MLVVLLIMLAASTTFRAWYVSVVPRLFQAWCVVMVVLVVAWLCAFAGMAFISPSSLRAPATYFFAGGSLLGFSEFVWSALPAFAGLYSALKHRAQSVTKIGLVVFTLMFMVFGGLAMRLSGTRGGSWSLGDTLIRLGAILCGAIALAFLTGNILPRVLDRLERRGFQFFVAARHVRADKSGFLTVISILSIMGVAVSSMTLFTVSSIMGGFSADLKRKILGNNAHIVIDTESRTPFDRYDDIVARVQKVSGVAAATPVVHGECMISSSSNLAGVMVRGINPDTVGNVVELKNNIDVGKLEFLKTPEVLTQIEAGTLIAFGPHGDPIYKGPSIKLIEDTMDPDMRDIARPKSVRPGIILGRELAKTIHVMLGDEVTLVSPLGDLGPMGMMPRTKKFRVAGVFYSGMYEYDASQVYVDVDTAQSYFQTGTKASVIDVKVESAEQVERYLENVRTAVGRTDLRVRDWREINKNLFSALKLEKFATFVILSFAIIVASFCIICTLLLMVTEKGKEIAILKALGASNNVIRRTFVIEGLIIGATGTTFGMTTGLALCAGVSWFGLRLDPEVYYIDRLPINVSGWDFLGVTLASLVICTISTILPASAAASLRPVEGLRHE
jgi:lipoprotein-releasing system permease protein